jgi:hypothetical protein
MAFGQAGLPCGGLLAEILAREPENSRPASGEDLAEGGGRRAEGGGRRAEGGGRKAEGGGRLVGRIGVGGAKRFLISDF